MKKFRIIHKETNRIICKCNGRHYRQYAESIDKGLKIVETSKGRAERERDFLNKEYEQGWEIQEVENER